jgi:hypothetical protein
VIQAQNIRQPWAGRRRDDADAQGAHRSVLGLPGELLGLRRRAQHAPGLLEKHAAGLRQGHGARGPLQEAHVEFLLQGLDLGAQCRLRKPQTLGGAAEVQFLRHRHKIAQMSQFHAVCPVD